MNIKNVIIDTIIAGVVTKKYEIMIYATTIICITLIIITYKHYYSSNKEMMKKGKTALILLLIITSILAIQTNQEHKCLNKGGEIGRNELTPQERLIKITKVTCKEQNNIPQKTNKSIKEG